MDKYNKKFEEYEEYDLFQESSDLQNYYWALQKEVLVKTAADKLKEALDYLHTTQLTKGEKMTYDQYKEITKAQSLHNEAGKSVTDADREFWHKPGSHEVSDTPFDILIREQVFKLLKFKGDFTQLIKSNYFLRDD